MSEVKDAAYWAEQARKYAEKSKTSPAPPAHPLPSAPQAQSQQPLAPNNTQGSQGPMRMVGNSWDPSHMTPDQYQQFMQYYPQYYPQYLHSIGQQGNIQPQSSNQIQPSSSPMPNQVLPPTSVAMTTPLATPVATKQDTSVPAENAVPSFVHPSRMKAIGTGSSLLATPPAQESPPIGQPPQFPHAPIIHGQGHYTAQSNPPTAPSSAPGTYQMGLAGNYPIGMGGVYGMYGQPSGPLGQISQSNAMTINMGGVSGYSYPMTSGNIPGSINGPIGGPIASGANQSAVGVMGQHMSPHASTTNGMPSTAQLNKLPAWMRDALVSKLTKEQKEKEKEKEKERRRLRADEDAAVAMETGEQLVGGEGKTREWERETGVRVRVEQRDSLGHHEKSHLIPKAVTQIEDLEFGLDDEERIRLEAQKLRWILLTVLAEVTTEEFKSITMEIEEGPWMARLLGRSMPKARPAARITVPVASRPNMIGREPDNTNQSHPSGALLGLATYGSDDENQSSDSESDVRDKDNGQPEVSVKIVPSSERSPDTKPIKTKDLGLESKTVTVSKGSRDEHSSARHRSVTRSRSRSTKVEAEVEAVVESIAVEVTGMTPDIVHEPVESPTGHMIHHVIIVVVDLGLEVHVDDIG
eukprot:Ihof_evm18s3 gene=Ihof_evmTU18s3